jgi:hypothetical protein
MERIIDVHFNMIENQHYEMHVGLTHCRPTSTYISILRCLHDLQIILLV